MQTLRYTIAPLIVFVITACGTSHKSVSNANSIVLVNDSTAAGGSTALKNTAPVNTNPDPAAGRVVAGTLTNGQLQQKYARYLGVSTDLINNTRLYVFIDHWLWTPYKWGGTDKKGIDCSSFIQKLLDEVYQIRLPRTSIQQFFNDYIEKFRSTDYLSEGDLVFFRTMDDKVVSHVGVYLHNRMFVNAASSKGVSIASMDDAYWKKRYVAAGRVKASMLGGYRKRS